MTISSLLRLLRRSTPGGAQRTVFHFFESTVGSVSTYEDTQPAPRADPYEVREPAPAGVRPFLEQVVFNSPLVKPEFQEGLFLYLADGQPLTLDRQPANRFELKLHGVTSRAPLPRGLLEMLTREGLHHPVPASIPSVLINMAMMQWIHAEKVSTSRSSADTPAGA